jgi:hypothetical protein
MTKATTAVVSAAGNLLYAWIGAKIAQLLREVFAIASDGTFTEGASKIYVRPFPPAR